MHTCPCLIYLSNHCLYHSIDFSFSVCLSVFLCVHSPAQLVTTYRTVQREKEKSQVIFLNCLNTRLHIDMLCTIGGWKTLLSTLTKCFSLTTLMFCFFFPQTILSQSQDKALRRIGELREVRVGPASLSLIKTCKMLNSIKVLFMGSYFSPKALCYYPLLSLIELKSFYDADHP